MIEVFSLLNFFDSVGQIKGRKKLQKMIYVLECYGYNFPFKYEYHYYGPYSPQLQEQVRILVGQGLLSEEYHSDTYTYQITEQGRNFKQLLANSLGYDFSIDNAILENLKGKTPQFLEMVSTYIFLLDSNYTPEAAAQKAVELKPHLSGFISNARSFVSEILYYRTNS